MESEVKPLTRTQARSIWDAVDMSLCGAQTLTQFQQIMDGQHVVVSREALEEVVGEVGKMECRYHSHYLHNTPVDWTNYYEVYQELESIRAKLEAMVKS